MSEAFRVSLKKAELNIVVETEDGEKHWKLLELEGPERAQYRNKFQRRVVLGKDGQPSGLIKSFIGLEAELLELCLYDENDQLLSHEAIEALPAKVQSVLFEKARELSGLNQEDVSKND